MAEREEFEQVDDMFAMLKEMGDTIKCRAIYEGMGIGSQRRFLNTLQNDDDAYTFYAYLS